MTIKERRTIAAAKGFCASCRCRRPRAGRRTCDRCLNKRNETRVGDSSELHVCCQSHGFHRFDCRESEVRAYGPYRRVLARAS